MTYRAYGKQVKRGNEHIADAASDTYAQIIADALNGERCPTAGVTRMLAERYGADQIDMSKVTEAIRKCREPTVDTADFASITFRDYKPCDSHHWQRQQDEYACSCGARWAVTDGDDHP